MDFLPPGIFEKNLRPGVHSRIFPEGLCFLLWSLWLMHTSDLWVLNGILMFESEHPEFPGLLCIFPSNTAWVQCLSLVREHYSLPIRKLKLEKSGYSLIPSSEELVKFLASCRRPVALRLQLLLLLICHLFMEVRLRIDWEPQLLIVSVFQFIFPTFFPSQWTFSSLHCSVLFQWGGTWCPPTIMPSSVMEVPDPSSFWGQIACLVSPLCRNLAWADLTAAWDSVEEISQQQYSPAFVFFSRSSFHACSGYNRQSVEQYHHVHTLTN